jgi:hypothetical protein
MRYSFGWDKSLNRDDGLCHFDSLDEAVRGDHAHYATPRAAHACDLPFHGTIVTLQQNQYAYATSIEDRQYR